MAEIRARRLTVRGRVQGVFFRASTRERAQQHGVAGWVANRADGAVEAWIEGPADAVDALERWIRDGGPPRAAVDAVEVEDVEPAGHRHFEVRRG
ncbi:MAG TPA: acylphosphatase [Egicoccus sp.]|nr:acylphosphatase [Egicoccus sp.]HSK22638.1 acylphosphatase [Egicoccus sp.]